MQFHILDENYIPVAVMDNDLPEAIHFSDSEWHRYLNGTTGFFNFKSTLNHPDSNCFQIGYWIYFNYEDRDYYYSISDINRDRPYITIQSQDLNLDLRTEQVGKFESSSAQPISYYLNIFLNTTGYEIGLNELSDLKRTLSWDGEDNRRGRVLSVATQFDNAELDFEAIRNSDFSIKKRLVHIRKKIGVIRDDIELEVGRNIKAITSDETDEGLCTAIEPSSEQEDGSIITIASLPSFEEKDEYGNVIIKHVNGSPYILAPQANQRYGNKAKLIGSEGYIVYQFSYNKIAQTELKNRAVTYLKEHMMPAMSYKTDGYIGAGLGDTFRLSDFGYKPPLLMEARVFEQVISFDNFSLNKTELGNYRMIQSQISSDLTAKMEALAKQNAPYKTQTLTTNGIQFKNNEGSTTLTARLFKGTNIVVPDAYNWFFDETTLSETSNQLTVNADEVDEKVIIRWNAVIGNNIVASDEITITDVSDGSDGETPQVIINDDTSVTFKTSAQTETTPTLKGADGVKGDSGIILSNTAPVNPTVGQLWQDTSSIPMLISKWTGTEWDDSWGLYAENLIVTNLAVLGYYESWVRTTGEAYVYDNGVQINNGVIMTLAIENPDNANPYVRGTINTSGQIRFYQGAVPRATTLDRAKMFNRDGSNTFFYNPTYEVGYIDSYKYGTGQGQITYQADEHNFLGRLKSNYIPVTLTTTKMVAGVYYTGIDYSVYDELIIHALTPASQVTFTISLTHTVLTPPDGAYPYTATGVVGTVETGAASREYAVLGLVSANKQQIRFVWRYRDGGNNWTNQSGADNANYVYRIEGRKF